MLIIQRPTIEPVGDAGGLYRPLNIIRDVDEVGSALGDKVQGFSPDLHT